MIRLSPGQQIEPPPLAAHDVSYIIGSHHCHPCRRIRISVARSGTLEARTPFVAVAVENATFSLPSLDILLGAAAYERASTKVLSLLITDGVTSRGRAGIAGCANGSTMMLTLVF
jgi:hypothetical protein